MKRLISFFSAAALTMGMIVPCTLAEDTYIYLQSAADIKEFADKCVIDSYSTGKVAVLQADIDVSGVDFTGIPYINGTFDGAGHTISGVKLEVANPERGFIGTVGENGIVKNLTVDAVITEKSDGSSGTGSGANTNRVLKIIENLGDEDGKNAVDRFVNNSNVYTVGGIAGINKGFIGSCNFKGSLKISRNAGGIAGINEGRIEACTNDAVIISKMNTGGIAGKNSGIVKWSKNYGKINNTAEEEMYATGGICGYSNGVIEACTNYAEIGYKHAGTGTGGICGIQSGNISECINEGAVLGKNRVGGISGNFEPYANITYNPDEWSDRIDEQKDKIRNDLDDIESRIDSNRDKIKSDLDDWDNRMNDIFGFGKVGDAISDAAKNGEGVAESLKNLNDTINNKVAGSTSLSDAVDSLSRAVDVLNNMQGDLSADQGEIIDFIREARNTASTMSEVTRDISDSFTEGNDRIMNLVDSLNDNISDEERRDRLNKTLDAVNDSLESTSKALDAVSGWDIDLGDIRMPNINLGILEDTDSELSRILRRIYNNDDLYNSFTKISQMFNDVVNAAQDRKAKLEELKKWIEDELNKVDLPTLRPWSTGKPSGEENTPLPVVTKEPVAFNPFVITAHAEEDDKTTIEKLLDMDIHDVDIPLEKNICGEDYELALIKYCVNSAEVSGLNDIGGISGGVGFEVSIGSGKNIEYGDETISLNPSTAIKSVIAACINEGDVTAKNNSAGGITGFSDLGKIKDSINSGRVEVTDGNYGGGISGYNLNEIMRCINIGDIEAQNDIGGITGYGKSISQTYALTRTSSDGERIGAIAGTAGGTIENNYFLKEKLGGINGVDYSNKAQPVDKEVIAREGEIAPELSGLEERYWTAVTGEKYMPQLRAFTENTATYNSDLLKAKSAGCAKFTFTADFIIDGQSVKSMNLQYGEKIPQEEIPEIPKLNGQYGSWNHDTDEEIIRNTKFIAEYNKSTSSISYGGEPPQILVEGDFKPDSTLDVREFNPASIINDKKYDALYGYEMHIMDGETEYEGAMKVHVRVPKDSNNFKIGLITDSSVLITDAELDGSYLLFDPEGAERFIVLKQKPSMLKYEVIGAALLLLLMFIFRKRIKERRLLNKLIQMKSRINLSQLEEKYGKDESDSVPAREALPEKTIDSSQVVQEIPIEDCMNEEMSIETEEEV